MSNHPMKPPRISKHPHQYSEQERYDAYNKTNKNNNNRNNNNKNQNTIALMTGCNFSLVTLVLLLMIVSILHNTEMIYDAVYDLKPGENAPGFWSSGGNNGNNKEGRREGPRIVLMAGPHKTASSSLQQFFAEFAGSSVLLEHKLPEAAGFAHRELRYPHPANTEWVVPILPRKAGGVIKSHHALAQFVAEKSSAEFPNWEEEIGPDPSKRGAIANWFRRHVRARWDDGKKLILAAEALDYVTVGLRDHRCGGNGGGNGERTHLAPGADEKIDTLLELLPWEHHLDDENENDDDDENNDNQSDNRKQPPLRLDDIEVQINYRTPRFDHLVSLWHQMGNTQTLRDWLVKPKTMSELLLYENLTTINALGEALQFVRRGIRVTLIDMAGVAEREKRSGNAAGRVPRRPASRSSGGSRGSSRARSCGWTGRASATRTAGSGSRGSRRTPSSG